MKKNLIALCALFLCGTLWAAPISIQQFNYAGPYEVKTPFIGDSANVQNKKYSEKELLNSPLSFSLLRTNGQVLTAADEGIALPGSSYDYALHLLSFYLASDRYCTGSLVIDGADEVEIYVDNKLQKGSAKKLSLTLEPRTYEVVIKYLSKGAAENRLKVSYETEQSAEITTTTASERTYTLGDVFDGKRIQSATLSPSGKYYLVNYSVTYPGGRQTSYRQLVEQATGRILLSADQRNLQWMPRGDQLYFTRQGIEGRELVIFDPINLKENILTNNLPEGSFRFAPTEDFLLFSIAEEGPEERKDIYEVLVPDDRQPGWRTRSFIHKYDLATGLMQRLTYGYLTTSINDISPDGRFLLFSTREPFLTERPFTRASLYRMDLETFETDTILKSAGFVSRAQYAPDGKQLLIAGSPEAFNGIGLNVAPGQTANMGDAQLFLYNLSNAEIKPLTKEFDPSIDQAVWNSFDNLVYIMGKDRDWVRLYTLDPAKGIFRTVAAEEDVVSNFSLAKTSPALLYYGLSASNSQRLYVRDMKKNKTTLLEDLSKEILKDIRLGEVQDWNFTNAQGDTIYGRYYLPPNFDANKKYPMIVNYYGGTTPTARVMESRYASHVYAGLGFIVYIVQPSGATGFGQEFSARHVNTWGIQTADDIIEGTKKFCDDHSFVNREKIGCMGASYGGFMTMLLQTKTDIFAAAMSHAGISDITSYWGEGYWGYSYSAQATANRYPWNARDIYVEQSPLFHADKVNTPILFLHGASDTNVPVGESIQMFTALKLLGKPTAMVLVDKQDHQIHDYDKRIRWNNSIYAWFYKWLKDQPEWWDALYPPKNL
ncbi:dipeptidyl aminopeptidase/acylaminoacyl peptidase [Parabacteroides sp. PFB2-12]|uniref:S9 family peptidase n=1 Tax=unclassified Parabacteroides TaxID=2649774 RepID=UPI002474EC9A|nr:MULTISPECIES: prolyl oligopeptidase family serine peptidase [unclassified Parabacteroides]MDH6342554.1 dipeptidyl aminopeptidase/acylaminoacyl peptidase [Parabacteroides sp. PM6-13]MDH6390206.1 dipeptidyl aminopeptidase/acylaminoacyl peptidase [Parabacteroides sp. PFB2-12]